MKKGWLRLVGDMTWGRAYSLSVRRAGVSGPRYGGTAATVVGGGGSNDGRPGCTWAASKCSLMRPSWDELEARYVKKKKKFIIMNFFKARFFSKAKRSFL